MPEVGKHGHAPRFRNPGRPAKTADWSEPRFSTFFHPRTSWGIEFDTYQMDKFKLNNWGPFDCRAAGIIEQVHRRGRCSAGRWASSSRCIAGTGVLTLERSNFILNWICLFNIHQIQFDSWSTLLKKSHYWNLGSDQLSVLAGGPGAIWSRPNILASWPRLLCSRCEYRVAQKGARTIQTPEDSPTLNLNNFLKIKNQIQKVSKNWKLNIHLRKNKK